MKKIISFLVIILLIVLISLNEKKTTSPSKTNTILKAENENKSLNTKSESLKAEEENKSLDAKSESLKTKLLIKAEDGNINAMIDLDTDYQFAHTQEGLTYYKKWYPLILKQNTPEAITEFSKVFKKYQDMFINGEMKYKQLLDTAKVKGSTEALYELLKYYKNDMIGNKVFKKKYNETVELILNDKSKENLEKFRTLAYDMHKSKLIYRIETLMIKKGYIHTNLKNRNELNTAYSESHYIGHDENRLPNIVDKIIKSNSVEDIYYASKQIKHREPKLREKLLQTALKLTTDKKLKGEIYFDLVDTREKRIEQIKNINEYYRKKLRKTEDQKEIKKINIKLSKYKKEKKKISNKEKIIELYEKAVTYDNLKAMKKLFYIYKKDMDKYEKEFHLITKKLKSSDEGSKFFIDRYSYTSNIDIYDKLAKKGDKNLILLLAKQNLKNENPKLEEIARKWRYYILRSNNYELHLDMKKILLSSSYNGYEKTQAFLKRLNEKEKNWHNIFILRENIKELRRYYKWKKVNEGLQLAYSYGDIKSALKLAETNFHKGLAWDDEKNEEEKKNIKRAVKKGIDLYKELAQKGEVKAYKKLGDIFSKEKFMNGTFHDYKKALNYYEKATNLGNENAAKKAIDIYRCKTCGFYNMEKVIKNLTVLVEKGTETSYANKLGHIYYKKGKYQDLKKAEKYFKISESYYYLTKLYSDKNGIKVDPKKAASYIKKCASLDIPSDKCNYLMGIFYKDGFGVKKDLTKATQYLHSASHDRHNPEAALTLGKIYEDNKQYKKAAKLYLRASKYKMIEIIVKLGELYKKGYLTKKDIKPLFIHFEENYNYFYNGFDPHNVAKGAYCLGFMYEKGIGTNKDIKKAKEWYKKANAKEDSKRLEKI